MNSGQGERSPHAPASATSRFLLVLRNCIARVASDAAPEDSELRELVEALNDKLLPRDALVEAMLRHITIKRFAPGGGDAGSAWVWGAPWCRRELIDRLRRRAIEIGASEQARAAVCLAMQEGCQFGPAWTYYLLHDPDVVRLSTLAKEEVDRLLQWADEEQRLTGRMFTEALRAAEPLDRMVNQRGPGMDPTDAAAFFDAADAMTLLPGRPDVRWQTIHLLWKALNLAKSRQATDMAARVLQRLADLEKTETAAHVRRWIREARTEPLSPDQCASGLRIVNESELIVPDRPV